MYYCIYIFRNIVLIGLAIGIQNRNGALTLPLALFTLNRELAMGISLCIKGWFCDIDSMNVWNFMYEQGYVVDYDLSILISLKQ